MALNRIIPNEFWRSEEWARIQQEGPAIDAVLRRLRHKRRFNCSDWIRELPTISSGTTDTTGKMHSDLRKLPTEKAKIGDKR